MFADFLQGDHSGIPARISSGVPSRIYLEVPWEISLEVRSGNFRKVYSGGVFVITYMEIPLLISLKILL